MGLSGPLPARVPAEVKELVLKTVDDAVADGVSHSWVCRLWQVSDDRVHRWRARRRQLATLVDRAPGGNPVHGILAGEIDAILDVAERWGPIDRSHRKLAHRGSYEGLVWVAPSTFRRVLAAHGLVLPDTPARVRSEKRPWPDWLIWEPNRIWIYDATHFTRAKRVVFAIVDMVSRYWIDTLVSVEESATQVKVIFEHALETEGLLELLTDQRLDLAVDDPARPILLAVSDNGPPMAATDTRAFMTLMAIAPAPRAAPTPRPTKRGSRASSATSRASGPHRRRPHRPRRARGRARPHPDRTTTRCGCTKRSATSPPTTNTTDEENPSARPAGKASPEPANSGSNSTAGTTTTTPRRHRDLDHFHHDLRGKVRNASVPAGTRCWAAKGSRSPTTRSGRLTRPPWYRAGCRLRAGPSTPTPAAAINVDAWIDYTALVTGPANANRSDVGAAYPLWGPNHGYWITVPFTTGGSHQVCAWAYNSGPGTNTQLANSWQDDHGAHRPAGGASPPPPPRNTEGCGLQGWAIDPATASPINVAVRRYTSPTTFTTYPVVAANAATPTVSSTYAAWGAGHGFDITVPGVTVAGTTKICVVGSNVGHRRRPRDGLSGAGVGEPSRRVGYRPGGERAGVGHGRRCRRRSRAGASTPSSSSLIRTRHRSGVDTSSPYSINWNSAGVADGTHTVKARAKKNGVVVGESAPRTFTVANAVTLTLTAPTAGAATYGTLLLTATPSAGVTSVEFLVDGTVVGTDTTAPYDFDWNSATTTDGFHTVTARAKRATTVAATTGPVTVDIWKCLAVTTTPAPQWLCRRRIDRHRGEPTMSTPPTTDGRPHRRRTGGTDSW